MSEKYRKLSMDEVQEIADKYAISSLTRILRDFVLFNYLDAKNAYKIFYKNVEGEYPILIVLDKDLNELTLSTKKDVTDVLPENQEYTEDMSFLMFPEDPELYVKVK